MVVNSHLSIHNRFFGFTSWSRTSSTSSIVPAFLRSTSCGMTSARGHGAIVYCLNSGSECCVKGILGTGGVMDKCVQMWTRNYGALGQTARERRKRKRKVGRGGRGDPGERTDERSEEEDEKRSGRENGRRGERREDKTRETDMKTRETDGEKGRSPETGVKKTMNAGGVQNGNMN
ncbi:hypothetical protein TNCV_4381021 [Trichonephila clavipes]|nr:hypothetical protein TNCV_4381021 [Trichonephila clavipes]